MKKVPIKGQHPPCHAVKGKGLIHAPPECVLQFLQNEELSKKIDELLKEGMLSKMYEQHIIFGCIAVQIIEKINDFVYVRKCNNISTLTHSISFIHNNCRGCILSFYIAWSACIVLYVNLKLTNISNYQGCSVDVQSCLAHNCPRFCCHLILHEI